MGKTNPSKIASVITQMLVSIVSTVNNNNRYMFQHILLGMCGTSPISPGRLVLSVAIWTPDMVA